jgi:hypothetical protein
VATRAHLGAPAYLAEHHETVLNALRHATDLSAREAWETTFWVRCWADARTLQRMLRRSIFEATGHLDRPVLTCVGLVRAQRPVESAPGHLVESWGVFVTVRPD